MLISDPWRGNRAHLFLSDPMPCPSLGEPDMDAPQSAQSLIDGHCRNRHPTKQLKHKEHRSEKEKGGEILVFTYQDGECIADVVVGQCGRADIGGITPGGTK